MADDTEENTVQPSANPSVASLVYNGLIQRGVNPNVAYGAIGSLMGESGSNLNASAIARGDGSDGSDSLGFGQWNGPRARNLQATAASLNLPWNSGQAQAAHLFNELDGKYSNGNYSNVLKALQAGKTVADGNDIWTRQYEVPANVDAQVAARLAHGNALAQGAQQGTLDLSKVGAIGSLNGTINGRAFQAMAPGALSASNLAGGDGALWDAVNQQPGQDWHDRINNIASIMASMGGNANLASSIKGMNTPNTSQADKLIKFYALKKAAQAANNSGVSFQGTLTDGTPYYTNQQGAVSDAQGNALPNDFMTQHSQKPGTDEPKTQQITKYSEATANATNAAAMDERLAKVQQELVSNPEIAKDLNGLTPLRSWTNNFLGASDNMSQWQKEYAALTKGYVVALQRTLPSRMSTDKARQMELDSIMPNGAQNDPITAYQSIVRMRQALREGFGNQISAAQNYAAGFPDAKSVGYINDAQGNRVKLDDYAAAQQKAFADRQDAIDKAYPAFKNAHDIRAGIKKPQSFMDMFSSGN